MSDKPFLLLLGGPTGAGKTALAIELYVRYGWPIVSADSRQIYRYLDIGTNKASQELQAVAPHFLLDICEPDESYSAGRFVEDVEKLIASWRVPVIQVVGGTGFYMHALLYGLDAIPSIPAEVRQRVESWINTAGLSEVSEWLRRSDPLTAQRIDLMNPRRVQRAVEVLWATGRPLASFWTGKQTPQYAALQVVLSLPKDTLDKVIAERTRWQVAAGWFEETMYVLQKGYAPTAPGLQTLGYKECLAVMRGELPAHRLLDSIIVANRQYARRQLTWWRGHAPDMWIESPDLKYRITYLSTEIEKRLCAGRA